MFLNYLSLLFCNFQLHESEIKFVPTLHHTLYSTFATTKYRPMFVYGSLQTNKQTNFKATNHGNFVIVFFLLNKICVLDGYPD